MSLTVAFLPVYHNPYQHLLTAALQKTDVQVEHHDRMPSTAWLIRQRQRVDVLHMHWLYGLYMRRYLTPFTWTTFIARFLLARRLGYRIVWTAHNIVPHRMPFPPIHLAVRRLMMAQADAVIAHCEYGRDELERRFPRPGPIHVVPHGNYAGVHPITMTRTAARAALDISPGQFVYLLLGNIAPYKGIETTVETVQHGGAPDDLVLIAGRNRAPALVDRLTQIAATDHRIRLHPGFIPEDEMERYLLAGDVMVFSFEKILTSGSVILGMTYGLPIVAPAMGCLPELISPDAGILYDPDDPTALSDALSRIKTMDTQAMGAAAKAIADTLRWDDIARQTAAIYRQCVAAR